MRVALLVLATLATIAAVSAATATQDPIQTRKKLMDANGAAAGLAFGMYSGKIPFNADAATAALQTFNSVTYAFGDYFPEGSDRGDTKANPKIWQNMADFQSKLMKLRQDSEKALAAKPAELASLKALLDPISKDCKSCHEAYKLK